MIPLVVEKSLVICRNATCTHSLKNIRFEIQKGERMACPKCGEIVRTVESAPTDASRFNPPAAIIRGD